MASSSSRPINYLLTSILVTIVFSLPAIAFATGGIDETGDGAAAPPSRSQVQQTQQEAINEAARIRQLPPVPLQGSTAPAAAATTTVLTPVKPELSVPIPGLTFSDPTVTGDKVSIPFLAQYISAVYRYLLGISTLVAIIMVIYGGFLYLLSASLPQVQNGKKILQDAVGGLIVLYCSYLILWTVNPKLVNLQPIRIDRIQSIPISDDASSDSSARDLDPENAGAGPRFLCRENLVNTPRQAPRRAVWCAACGGCRVISTGIPDGACQALIGTCGGSFGEFLSALTGQCRGKTFGWLETLDGGTFGILHYTENEFAPLMQKLQRKDPTAYQRVIAVGNGATISNEALCSSNRQDRGFVCNPGYRAMLQAALQERSFTLVQLEDAYNRYLSRRRSAESHGFHSAYGQAMWATVANNPGSCGAGFSNVLAACASAFQGTNETAKIDCFLEKYVELGCRDGYPGNLRRVQSIRANLQNVSQTQAPAAPTLQALENCVPS